MQEIFAYLKEFNFASVCFRLVLALIAGGLIGFGRGRKKQTAGLRTYIITCVGAALSALMSYYLYALVKDVFAIESFKFDGSRYYAAVISGMGFLAAGSIMLVAHQQVSGLTTAIGLFVDACIGLACGAGFYEVVIVAVVMIVFVMEGMYNLELAFKRKMRNMTIHVDFDDLEHMDMITETVKSEGATVYDFEFEDTSKKRTTPSAILWIKLSKENPSHSSVLSAVAELDCVFAVQELIS